MKTIRQAGEDLGHPGQGLEEEALLAVPGGLGGGGEELGPGLTPPGEVWKNTGLGGQDLPAFLAPVEGAVGPGVMGGHVTELLDLRGQDLGV